MADGMTAHGAGAAPDGGADTSSSGIRPVLVIDGRSGSGKTELARAIVAGWPEAQLLRMDDLYPGWEGLAQGSEMLAEALATGRWRRWDWGADSWGEIHEIDPARPLVVEGVGSLTPATRERTSLAVWVDADAALRRERALARDPYFAEHWEAWARQEREMLARHDPRDLADAVLPGAHVTAFATTWRRRAQDAAAEAAVRDAAAESSAGRAAARD